jgi:DNA modification methylase
MKFREEQIGACRLILGDCREVLPTIGRVDAVVTDPPYGVELGNAGTGQERERGQTAYEGFEDTPEYIESIVVPACKLALSLAKRGLITPGNRNSFLYPKPDDIGVWWNPAGTGRGKWGFLLAHVILYYGPDPNAGQKSTAASVTGCNSSVGDIKNILHPCPKPLNFMQWCVNKASLEDETILDPFMGSGTTLVACAKLGRKGIGIELEPKYFDIACRRVEQAYKQGDMFIPQPEKLTQGEML